MFCTSCGSRLPEGGAKFCPNCGAPVHAVEPFVPEAEAEDVKAEAFEAVEPAVEAVEEVKAEAAEAVEEVQTEAVETAEEAAETFEEAREEAVETAEEAAETVEEVRTEAVETAEEAAETFEEVKAETAEAVEEVKAETAAPSAEPVKEIPAPEPAAAPAAAAPAKAGLHFTATLAIVLTALTFLLSMFALIAVFASMHEALIILLSIFAMLCAPLAFGFGAAAFIVGLKKKRKATWIIGLIAALLNICMAFMSLIYLIAGFVKAVA